MKTAVALISLALILAIQSATAQELNLRQSTMLQTLQQVVTVFSEEYAPLAWKAESEKFDLAVEVREARKVIESSPALSTADFQNLLSKFVKATRDFHVSVSFYSTEMSTLPFQIMGANGRYFVVSIERGKIPKDSLPQFDVGTEIVAFGGVEIDKVVKQMTPERFKEPSPTELRLAEFQLTTRSRSEGMKVPTGEVLITVKNSSGSLYDIPFIWEYTAEYVPLEFPIRNMIFEKPEQITSPRLAAPLDDGPYAVDGRSMVPDLGTVLATASTDFFKSYIFRLPRGHVIGFVRIPTFNVDKPLETAEAFGQIVSSYNEKTDALIIDLTHNGGGSMTYMYGLLSRLTDRPLETLPQQIMISSAMAAESAKRLVYAPFIKTDEDAKKIVDPLFPGMLAGFQTFQAVVNNDRFILNELREGRRLSRPTHLLGISRISPHPTQRYTKPILVLVNELDFSAADFFPAILQDNKRALIFGTRTAGAGGAVKQSEFPNQFGIRSLNYTWTIAQRLDGRQLENVGVTPDIHYSPTVNDLQNGFQEYAQAVARAIETELIKK